MKPAMNIVTEPSGNSQGNKPSENNGAITPHAGQVIGDRYRLEQPLESGAMGSVWRAEHVRLKAPVAVKFLEASLIHDSEMRDRFTQEARSAAAVRSANVVQVLDYGTDGGVPYIAMELLEGENLDMRLSHRGRLAPDELRKIFTEIARGIGKAHAMGVVHRDLKPGNIFIAREGDHEVTKLVDFGIAKVKADALNLSQIVGTQLGTLLGTPQYMSPEQMRGSAAVDYRTDLWALAIIACECLTGRYPFSGNSIGDLTVQICTEKPLAPSSLGPVPPGFDQWFFKATRKTPSKRFESAEQMARALARLLVASGSSLPLVMGVNRTRRIPSYTQARLTYATVAQQLQSIGAALRQVCLWLADRATVATAYVRWKAQALANSLPEGARLPYLSRPVSFAVLGLLVLCGALAMRAIDGSSRQAATAEVPPEATLANAGLAAPSASAVAPPVDLPRQQVVLAALPRATAPEEVVEPPLAEAAAPALRASAPSPARVARPARAKPAAPSAADPIAEAAARILETPPDAVRGSNAEARGRTERTTPSSKPVPRTPAKPAGSQRHPFDDRL